MSTYADRLAALREQLKADRLDGFVVPLTDEHMSEYVGSYAQRLAWLTGFQGSAGSAVVLPEEAAIFVDGRYTLQVRDQVDGDHWSYQSVPETSIADWLKDACARGRRGSATIPGCTASDWVTRRARRSPTKGAELVAVERNPIDAVWADRPEPSKARLIVHPDELAGKSSADKRQEMADWLERAEGRRGGARRRSIRSPGRSTSAARTSTTRRSRWPSPWSMPTAPPTCSSPSEKIGDDVRQHLGNGVRAARARRVRGRARPSSRGKTRRGRSRAVGRGDLRGARQGRRQDRRRCATRRCCPRRSRTRSRSPATTPRRRATARRCRASSTGCRVEAPKGGVDELTAADQAAGSSASDSGELRDLQLRHHLRRRARTAPSSITGSSEETNRPLETDTLYLVDSRRPISRRHHRRHPHRRDRHADRRDARPLHPRAQGPYRARPRASSRRARAAASSTASRASHLWEAGLDYAHGTGHGVGSFLAVHEGPQRISPVGSSQAGGDEPLQRRHDPLQRARLLQDRRIWHPDRESGAGRRRARSRAPRRRCSASRRSPSRRSTGG